MVEVTSCELHVTVKLTLPENPHQGWNGQRKASQKVISIICGGTATGKHHNKSSASSVAEPSKGKNHTNESASSVAVPAQANGLTTLPSLLIGWVSWCRWLVRHRFYLVLATLALAMPCM